MMTAACSMAHHTKTVTARTKAGESTGRESISALVATDQ
jgi:hypothetical protein